MKKPILIFLIYTICCTPVLAQYTGGGGQGYAMSNTILDKVLPVEWLDFAAIGSDQGVVLHWTTASEINNDYFEVQHAPDGKQFHTIDVVDGHGTTDITSNYSYLHKTPVRGMNYYRLRQVDYDGQSEVSAIVSVMYTGQFAEELHLYPNPAITQLQLVLPHASDARIAVYDAQGKQVHDSRTTQIRRTSLDVSSLPPGLYMLICDLGHSRLPARFVVK